jgi:hypothetical protein
MKGRTYVASDLPSRYRGQLACVFSMFPGLHGARVLQQGRGSMVADIR